MSERVTIGRLREQFPEWTWHAVRRGWGWEYHGYLHDLPCEWARRTVRIYPVARHCGPAEDDFTTGWNAEEGDSCGSFASWWLSEAR